jgi:hypothetical protein
VDQLFLPQGVYLSAHRLFSHPADDELLDETAQQLMLSDSAGKEGLLLNQFLLGSIFQLRSEGQLQQDLADALRHCELGVCDAFLAGVQVVVVDAGSAGRSQEDSVQLQTGADLPLPQL